MRWLVAPLGAALGLAACAGDPLPDGARAEDCGSCHRVEYKAWSTSRLAVGADAKATSPVFKALLPRVEAAWGSVARARCVSCHSPGFGGDHGVGCVACHAAVGNRGVQNGALVVDLGAPLAASRPPGAETTAHDTEVREYLTSPELCGTCHVVHGPGLFEEVTLGELQASGKPDRACTSCHMPKTAGGEADHRFTGVDPAWGADPESAAAAAAESTALLGRAVTLEMVEMVDGASGVEVRLTNTGGGHAVPTGVSFLRDLWVDVRVVDAEGAIFDVPRVIALGARMTRGGKEVDLPTDADTIEGRVLAPDAAVSAPIEVPAGAVLPVTFEATLRARAVAARVMTALGIEERAGEVPELVVASVKR